MAGIPYLIDTNILLRWLKPDDRDYPLVVSAIDALLERDDSLCYTSPNVAEFWSTCTRPVSSNGLALSLREADRRTRIFESKLRILPDSLAVHDEWRMLIVRRNISGVLVYDAKLVAAMKVHSIGRILTFNNKDFVRFPEIEAIHPRSILLP